jgi:DNA-binding GntR family transcriptional regulator
VRQPGPVRLLEMFETMAELEAACGRFAATRMSDADLAALREINAACERAAADGDADRYYHENERFHHLIYQGAGNAYLDEQATRLHKRLKPYRRMQLHLRGRLQQSMAEHQAILRALCDGAPEAAAAALRGHVAVQGEKFHHLLSHMKPAT